MDEDLLEEIAERWGVDVDTVESFIESTGFDFEDFAEEVFSPELGDDGRPDPDYFAELADYFDVDVSDLYDLYYGYVPGGDS